MQIVKRRSTGRAGGAGELLTLGFLLALGAAAWGADTPAPGASDSLPFAARYEARVKVVGGEVRWDVSDLGDGLYQFNAVVQAGGIWKALISDTLTETSWFRLVDGMPRPERYRLHNGLGSRDRDGEYEFDWERGLAVGVYKDKPQEIQVAPGVVDRSLLQLVLMRDLSAGRRPERYVVLDRDELRTLEVEYGEGEVLRVPAGYYDTVLVMHRSDKRNDVTRLWCAPVLGYLPVQIEQERDGKRLFLARLASLEAR